LMNKRQWIFLIRFKQLLDQAISFSNKRDSYRKHSRILCRDQAF